MMTGTPDPRPTGSLLADAMRYLSDILRGEIAMARSEIATSIRSATVGLAMLAAALVFAITALNLLSAALVDALIAAGLRPGWAAVLVGLGFAILAAAFAWKGSVAFRHSGLIPRRTVRNLAKDVETLREGMTNG